MLTFGCLCLKFCVTQEMGIITIIVMMFVLMMGNEQHLLVADLEEHFN